ncbi:uncharacterized protein LOC141893971 isoform X3 [Acropora palmata]
MFHQYVVASAFVIVSFASVVTGQNACISLPCKSGESCAQGQNTSCLCKQGYTGQNCTQLTFKASIGISDVENYLPVIIGHQNDLTNYNAPRLRSRISFPVPFRSLTLQSTFKWTHNGTVLSLTNFGRVYVRSTTGVLNIFRSTLEDEGIYQSFISNELGTMFGRKFRMKFRVSGAFLSPTPTSKFTMIEGEPFVLPCPPRAYSLPRPEFDWISATGQVISNSLGPRIVMEPNGDLLFSYVDANDFNTFMNPKSGILSPLRCRVRHGGESILTGPPVYFDINRTNTTLSPSSPVRFYTKPQGVYTVLTGDQLYLNCTAGGRPVPEIFWYQNGSRIKDFGDSFLFQNYNRTLRLGSLHPKIHNGVYSCEAVGKLRKIASFQIKVLDNVRAVYDGRFDQLEFRAGKHSGSVKMFCNTTGHPIINRTWYYNGVEMKYSLRFLNRWSVDEHGILEIRQLHLKDFGVFQCVAKNLLSEGDRRTYLVVTGAPLPPTNVQFTDCTNHSTNISWDLRLPSDILPTAFIIEWRSSYLSPLPTLPQLAFSKLIEIPGFNRSYVVNNLTPFSHIEFRIRAKNSLGEGFPGNITSGCRTGAKRPSLFPKNFKSVHFATDGSLNLQWTPLDLQDWNGGNCIYRIYYRLNDPTLPWNNVTKPPACSRSSRFLTGLQPNSEYELQIRAENVIGFGPLSPVIRVISGQRTPRTPAKVTVVRVGSSSVEVEWTAISVSPPKTVDGYWIMAAVGRLYRYFGEFNEELLLSETERFSGEFPRNARAFSNDTIFVRVNTSLRGVVTGLKPWTTYELAVAGYNNAGTGSLKYQRVTTLDSKDSYFLLSLRITSEVFTEDLKDQSSNKYKALQANLTNEVSSLYQNNTWFKKASLLAFRPGSVVADVQLEVASPNMSVIFDVVSAMGSLGNFSLDRNETKMTIEQGIQNVTVNASSSRVNVTGKIVLSCYVIGGPTDLNITWYKASQVIGLTQRTKVETEFRHSTLTIRDVLAEDEGNYICYAAKGIQNRQSSVFIEVIPVLFIEPKAVTRNADDAVTFNCTVDSGFTRQALLSVVEVTNRSSPKSYLRSSFTAENLEIPSGRERAIRRFVCELRTNQQTLLSRSEEAELFIVLPDAPKCLAETRQGVTWTETAQEGTDVQPCPSGAIGSVTRECSRDATWKRASFTGCSSPTFFGLEDELEATIGGYQSNTSIGEVLSRLLSATQPVTNDTTRPSEIYGGDLLITVKILVALAAYNNVSQGNISSQEDVNNLVTVVSNLLDPGNSITWQNLEQEGRGRSRILIKTVDSYGLGVAATLNRTTKSRKVETKNLLMEITRVTRKSTAIKEGLNVSFEESSIQLPSEAFRSRDSSVVSVIYLTLNDVISLRKGKSENMTTLPNTTVVSSTVFPPPQKNFIEPVKIVLQNKRVSVPSGAAFKATCVFWRPGSSPSWKTRGCELVPSESDERRTTCKCDHLTIFASLMDPFDSNVGEAHRKALEMISIVGCSISLMAVLVTIAVSLMFWRAIKSPRAKVILNLCIAIALSCIFVISEGFARDNKVGCTVVAAFLHYFLLAMFSWMLCEGVLLYLLLVKVFGGSVEEKVKYFYLFGWGFPAIIVVTSLAATRAVGYGKIAHACWLDVDSGLIWAFIAPALNIILVNIVVFILVIRKMMGTRHVQNKTQIEKVKAGIKASAVVLPLLGITWLFGLLAFSSETIAFKYIFAIANSLQGLAIFIFHCLLNKQIKDAIKRMRDKSHSGLVSSNPKSKPSPKPQAKFALKQLEKVSKKSTRGQNDYEMMKNMETLRVSLENENGGAEVAEIFDEELPEETAQLKEREVELKDDLLAQDDRSLPIKGGSVPGPHPQISDEGHTFSDSLIFPEKEVIKTSYSQVEQSDVICGFDETPLEGASPSRGHEETHGFDSHIDLQDVTQGNNQQEPNGAETQQPCCNGVLDDQGMNHTNEKSKQTADCLEIEFVQFNADTNLADRVQVAGDTSLSKSPSRQITAKRTEPTQHNCDTVTNDEDFEVKMKERRGKVDAVQQAAYEFSRNKSAAHSSNVVRQGAWTRIRKMIHQGRFNVPRVRNETRDGRHEERE